MLHAPVIPSISSSALHGALASRVTPAVAPARALALRSSRRPVALALGRVRTLRSGGSLSRPVVVRCSDTDPLQTEGDAPGKAGKERPSFAEEARTLVQLAKSCFLATASKEFDGHPFGSVVDVACDEQGRPLFAISTLSAHTRKASPLQFAEAALQGGSRRSMDPSQQPRRSSARGYFEVLQSAAAWLALVVPHSQLRGAAVCRRLAGPSCALQPTSRCCSPPPPGRP
ncbi:hypothetical protein CYMTET_56627 [Cymbomonas tetramitiformis]|uniref:CREG-like beta-barrel domain-containing protein n=1 Tax=Cymbomonas tetramitiformis TaxID=36881 RepID=A0AAE0BBT9_9CHLO|nr:hypothetical protein CYMTET_56627 [Cymbomonas tetramitiformis]